MGVGSGRGVVIMILGLILIKSFFLITRFLWGLSERVIFLDFD